MWKKITPPATEVIKIVFQRAVCSNSSDRNTTKNPQQNTTHHSLFLGSYLYNLHFLLFCSLPSLRPSFSQDTSQTLPGFQDAHVEHTG